jgi:hypothetical protein
MITITNQFRRVAKIAKMSESTKNVLKMVFLRNGVLFASDGYMLSACKFPSNISGITQMINCSEFLKLEEKEVDEKLFKECESGFLHTADFMWDGLLKKIEHKHGREITIQCKYLKEVIAKGSESITLEFSNRLEPLMVFEDGVKSIVMPMSIDSSEMSEYKIGQYD